MRGYGRVNLLSAPVHYGAFLQHGASIAIDIQPEGSAPSILLGGGTTNRSSLIIRFNDNGVKNRLRVDISDEDGKRLSASAQCSAYAAKRLIIAIDARQSEVRFYELNIFPGIQNLTSEYSAQQNPSRFGPIVSEISVNGAYVDGRRIGNISSKVANFNLFRGAFTIQHARKYCIQEREKIYKFYGNNAKRIDPSVERMQKFREDMTVLDTVVDKLNSGALLSNRDAGDVSLVVYRWLLDRHPLLQDLCNELGLQLTFPTNHSFNQRKKTSKDVKLLLRVGLGLGRRSLVGFEWKTRRNFINQEIRVINERSITLDMLVKFVSDKLGGRHLDVVGRQQWQRDLLETSGYFSLENSFMRVQMGEIARVIRDSVRDLRIEEQL